MLSRQCCAIRLADGTTRPTIFEGNVPSYTDLVSSVSFIVLHVLPESNILNRERRITGSGGKCEEVNEVTVLELSITSHHLHQQMELQMLTF